MKITNYGCSTKHSSVYLQIVYSCVPSAIHVHRSKYERRYFAARACSPALTVVELLLGLGHLHS